MRVRIETVDKDYASCTFCRRGEPKGEGAGLKYPYKDVWTVTEDSNLGHSVSFCNHCLKELFDKTISGIIPLEPEPTTEENLAVLNNHKEESIVKPESEQPRKRKPMDSV